MDIIKIKSLNRKIFKFNIPEKSTKYLINRYYKNKFYDYFIYLIKYKSLETILVFRKITIKNNNLLKIVDLIGNQKNISNIGEGINFLLKKYQSDYADLYSYGIEEKYLKLSGFINRYKTDLIIPEYFEPFINKNIDINFGYINKFNKKKVRLVKGDGDTDRPSII